MKQLLAFLTLIPALLLFSLAYHGYVESSSYSRLQGNDFDHFASRASGGFSVADAQRQSALVTAGLEGLTGLGFLYAALSLSASSRSREERLPLLKRRERSPLPYTQPTQQARAPAYAQPETPLPPKKTLFQSGRARVEELRRARSRHRKAEKL